MKGSNWIAIPIDALRYVYKAYTLNSIGLCINLYYILSKGFSKENSYNEGTKRATGCDPNPKP